MRIILKRLFIKLPLHIFTFLIVLAVVPSIVYWVLTGYNLFDDLDNWVGRL